MKKTKKTLAIGLAAVALMAATSVQAAGEWSSYWVTDASTIPGGIDKITASISGGGTFVLPGTLTGVGATVYAGGYEANDYALPWPTTPKVGWSATGTSSTATTSGTPAETGNLYYWINLSSLITQSFTIDQKDWNGATLVGETIITYDGSGVASVPAPGEDRSWNNAGFTATDVPVPEPTTMIAGALLLLPFGASTLRMLRKRQTA